VCVWGVQGGGPVYMHGGDVAAMAAIPV
jgi:hypothetical protein